MRQLNSFKMDSRSSASTTCSVPSWTENNLAEPATPLLPNNQEDQYDAIVLGTGLKECFLGGLLSVSGKRVLHIDRNRYYGGESASISPLEEFLKKFGAPVQDASYGPGRDWVIDLIPKFIVANGNITKLLVHTGVTRYIEFKSVENSYIYVGGKISKVPGNAGDVLTYSNLANIFDIPENIKFRNFLIYVQEFQEDNPRTWKDFDPNASNMKILFDKFNLGKKSQECVGHALALYTDDEYLLQPALQTIKRIKLYFDSQERYGNSPYLYTMNGSGELLHGFGRLSPIYGGTFCFGQTIDEIVIGEEGRLIGVRLEEQLARCNQLFCDPSYVPNRIRKNGQVIRCICLLDHPIPNTDNSLSAQIIIPQNQVGRKSNIYVTLVSNTLRVAPNGKFIATISTTVETENPEEEIKPGLELLGPIRQKFVCISVYYEPVDDGLESQIFISKSNDASSNLEDACLDILDIYKRATGEEFDFSTALQAFL